MTKAQARDWLRVFGDLPDEQRHECEHGHKECSTTHRGACLDDVIQIAMIREEPCETRGGQRQIEVGAPDPEAPAVWCTCPECQQEEDPNACVCKDATGAPLNQCNECPR